MFTLETFAVTLFVVGILAVLLEGLRRESGAVIVNAVAALGVTFVPVVVLLPVGMGTPALVWEFTLWVAGASFLHTLGMLGLYESVAWWDHMTHTLSAGVLAAVFYPASVVTVSRYTAAPASTFVIASVTVVLVLAAGVAWELLELVARELGKHYDIEPVLVHYGRRDTALDLVFDAVGAVVVVALDVRLFLPVAERFPGTATAILAGSALLCAVGVVSFTAAILLLRQSD